MGLRQRELQHRLQVETCCGRRVGGGPGWFSEVVDQREFGRRLARTCRLLVVGCRQVRRWSNRLRRSLRANVGGSQSGQQAGYISRGSSTGNNKWSIDGVDITDMSATGASPARPW